ncbi:unnamed protein product [Aphanomyces euteiches]
MSNQSKEPTTKLTSAWEREKQIRLDNKIRLEKQRQSHHETPGIKIKPEQPQHDRMQPKTSMQKQHYDSNCRPESVSSTLSYQPYNRAIVSSTGGAFESQGKTSTGDFKCTGMNQPKIHKLEPKTPATFDSPWLNNQVAAKNPLEFKENDDALSVASDDTESDDDKLTDSLELSIAMSPKIHKKLTRRIESKPEQKKVVMPIPPKNTSIAFSRQEGKQVHVKENPKLELFKQEPQSAIPLSNPKMSTRAVPPSKPLSTVSDEAKARTRAEIFPAKEKATTETNREPKAESKGTKEPKYAPLKATTNTKQRDAKWEALEASMKLPKGQCQAESKAPLATDKPAQEAKTASHDEEMVLTIEEEQLKREISTLNLKLESKPSRSPPTTVEEPELTGYGGGAHHKVGTRTTPSDRHSLEKRRQTSGVHQMRVRKGPQVIIAEDKNDIKKVDKVTVKNDLAFMLLS